MRCQGDFLLKGSTFGACRRILVLLWLLVLGAYGQAPVGAGILQLTHKYSHREGSSKRNGDAGMSKEHFQLLVEHDRGRRGRFLMDGVDFSVGGNADPTTGGLYFTQVGLGTPTQNYIVQVDTGSDVLWVNCKPCQGCPRRSGLNIPLTLYDPQESSTQSVVSCSDPLCITGAQASEAACSQSNNCGYVFQYGDGSTTRGYYLRDNMQYTLVSGTSSMRNGTSKILFGCSVSQTGDLTDPGQAVDGIMGFGQLELSVPSQLAAQQNIPKVFSHCLEGEKQGGGILVIGEISEPGIVYTPLVPNSTHYNVNLLSVSVDSNKLPIDAEEFSSANGSGVIFDSGTTLAYLPSGAYNVFVNAIQKSTTASSVRVPGSDSDCYLVTDSLDKAFPKVTMNFAGGSSMELDPENYLLLAGRAMSAGKSAPIWCMGWQSSSSSNGPKDDGDLTILGDIVLKDKLVVYDLDNSRLGWVKYNCSDKVKVGGQPISASHLDTNNAVSTLRCRGGFLASFITTVLIATSCILVIDLFNL